MTGDQFLFASLMASQQDYSPLTLSPERISSVSPSQTSPKARILRQGSLPNAKARAVLGIELDDWQQLQALSTTYPLPKSAGNSPLKPNGSTVKGVVGSSFRSSHLPYQEWHTMKPSSPCPTTPSNASVSPLSLRQKPLPFPPPLASSQTKSMETDQVAGKFPFVSPPKSKIKLANLFSIGTTPPTPPSLPPPPPPASYPVDPRSQLKPSTTSRNSYIGRSGYRRSSLVSPSSFLPSPSTLDSNLDEGVPGGKEIVDSDLMVLEESRTPLLDRPRYPLMFSFESRSFLPDSSSSSSDTIEDRDDLQIAIASSSPSRIPCLTHPVYHRTPVDGLSKPFLRRPCDDPNPIFMSPKNSSTVRLKKQQNEKIKRRYDTDTLYFSKPIQDIESPTDPFLFVKKKVSTKTIQEEKEETVEKRKEKQNEQGDGYILIGMESSSSTERRLEKEKRLTRCYSHPQLSLQRMSGIERMTFEQVIQHWKELGKQQHNQEEQDHDDEVEVNQLQVPDNRPFETIRRSWIVPDVPEAVSPVPWSKDAIEWETRNDKPIFFQ